MAAGGFFPSRTLDNPSEGVLCYTLEGTQCYTKDNITTQTNKMTKLDSLAIGKYLRVEPSCARGGGLQYKGNSTISKCYEDDNGNQCSKRLHVVVIANKEKKTEQQLYGKEWLAVATKEYWY